MNKESSNKWLPFNAVADGGSMIRHVLKEKSKVKMPILSEDQQNDLQERMITAFNNQDTINIKYFTNGNIYIISGKITNIDVFSSKIVVNHEKKVYFSQIIEFF